MSRKKKPTEAKSGVTGGAAIPEEEILKRTTYVPHYLIVVTNGLAWHSSRQYLKHLGLGLNECRILTILADSGPISAVEIARITSMNKGAVSRALQVLEQQGYISGDADTGRRRLTLTAKSRPIHRQIVEIARAREAMLLNGFSVAEKATLLKYLQRMQENIPLTRAYTPIKG
jgi:DNA-binding MarR family transcriptional regulator